MFKNPRQNPNFCIVPWAHTYLSPQTERRLCCASREKSTFVKQYIDQPGEHGVVYSPISLEAHWNSEYMKDIRRKMLSGEKLDECQVCNDQVLSLSTYRHWFNNVLFDDLIDKVLPSTKEDGSTSLEPVSFDYRFSNACNFKCRTCGDQFSSSWEQENRINKSYEFRRDPWLEPKNRAAISNYQATQVEEEFAAAIRKKSVRELYWVGGEPLMWEQHWKYMTEIVELGYPQKVFARYNTNLSKIEHRGTHLFQDILRHFKSYMISASIDGAGKIGEFIRSGLNWQQWLKNFEEGVKHSKGRDDTSMMFDVTISLPSLFCIEELLDEALRMNVRMEVKIMFAFDPFVILHPLSVPREAMTPFLNQLIKKIEPKITDKQRPLLNTLMDLKRRPTFQESWPDTWRESFIQGKKYLKTIGQRRNDGIEGNTSFEEIYSTEPSILEWWMS